MPHKTKPRSGFWKLAIALAVASLLSKWPSTNMHFSRPEAVGDMWGGSYQTTWGDLYVSRGIGTSMIPMRIGARPEIVLLELR